MLHIHTYLCIYACTLGSPVRIHRRVTSTYWRKSWLYLCLSLVVSIHHSINQSINHRIHRYYCIIIHTLMTNTQFHDRFRALRMMLFLTFEDPASRYVYRCVCLFRMYVRKHVFCMYVPYPLRLIKLSHTSSPPPTYLPTYLSYSVLAWWIAVVLVVAILVNCAAFLIGSVRRFQ